eukprot:TRINITY_DN23633_c0_g1_i1.p1 TRINITY_DN23633_c0_g1~~TRINITY_DN23633_c0_g1_i1.p1  ORF type:complete len:667 (+),score=158.07 TRINITY_DN23633_c0_g1_i1:29-2002(+)
MARDADDNKEAHAAATAAAAAGGGAGGPPPPPAESAGGDRTIVVEVPPGAEPGQTSLSVDLGEKFGTRLVVKVPIQAVPGDQLRLTRDVKGEWHCTVNKLQAPEAREVAIFVPAWATPGETILDVNVGPGQAIRVPVPPFAMPAEKILLKWAEKGGWSSTLVRHTLTHEEPRRLDNLKAAALRDVGPAPMDADKAFAKLVDAVVAAGGAVSPKLTRGALPPLNVPGILAREPIEAGEILCRIPVSVHLTPKLAEALRPDLGEALDKVAFFQNSPLRREKAMSGVFLAQLLHAAERRAAGDAGATARPSSGACDAEVAWRTLEAYADVLLGVDFSSHVYMDAARDFEALDAEFAPSPQADYIMDMACDLEDMYDALRNDVGAREALGPAFAPETAGRPFFLARLCLVTRVFLAECSMSLVPVVDLFNHSANHGVEWMYREAEKSMVVTAIRAHAAGEEIFDSYGPRSNELLHLTYGFAMPPRLEPSWNYQMRPERIHAILESFLPEDERQPIIYLESHKIDDTLIKVLNQVVDARKSVVDFLVLVCERCKSAYDEDVRLKPALEAFRRARSRDPVSAAWWAELAEEDLALADRDSTRVKMGEYLCLVAHIEAVNCWRRAVPVERCLKMTDLMRRLLCQALCTWQRGEHVDVAGEADWR